ncbi:hypothetical protein NITLEN_10109 [Nitrospira lenta]|uniref:Uncharacterized protein n=1 Tax=Nitrospira lenta TaxID=1436998 RepID=A0A330L1D2_9BACT|nr:hypothetical protein NITLEN_10109 [Nitrospira lenta]
MDGGDGEVAGAGCEPPTNRLPAETGGKVEGLRSLPSPSPAKRLTSLIESGDDATRLLARCVRNQNKLR